MTARGTDWGLAALVALLSATGALTLLAGGSGQAWVFAAHDGLGIAIALLLIVKLRRVWPRLMHPGRWGGALPRASSALPLSSGCSVRGCCGRTARRRARAAASHLRVVSVTGYRWSFALAEARGLLLATHVSADALSHEHGAPARLVVPGARGFQWVKWVTRIELLDHPDFGAPASTIWSSL